MEIITLIVGDLCGDVIETDSNCIRIQKIEILILNCWGFTCDYDSGYSVPGNLCSYLLNAKFMPFILAMIQRKKNFESIFPLKSLYNVLKCMGYTAVHIDSGLLSRKKKCQSEAVWALTLLKASRRCCESLCNYALFEICSWSTMIMVCIL